jgi:ADP-ribosylglycohydrolase
MTTKMRRSFIIGSAYINYSVRKPMLEFPRDQTTRRHPMMVGLANGDKIGGPTAMANILADSLAECGGLDTAELTDRYLEWWRADGFDTGPVFTGVMELIDQGVAPQEAVIIMDENHHGLTAGCNPAHRIAPLALVSVIPIKQLPELAMQEARISHWHPLAGDVSAAVAVLCRALLDGTGYAKAKGIAADNRLSETREALLNPEGRPLRADGYSPEVLRAATHFVDRSSCASEAVSEAVQFAGDSNYCPVLVGAISGARWGEYV